MRIREENCNLVLLGAVTLVSAVIAGGAALLPDSASPKSRPAYAAAMVPSPEVKPAAIRVVDDTPVRVVGAPFVPNTNPRER